MTALITIDNYECIVFIDIFSLWYEIKLKTYFHVYDKKNWTVEMLNYY